MKLCLNENTIHNVEDNKENRAIALIQFWVESCKFQDSCKNEDHQDLLNKLEQWSSSKCSKMVYLLMQAKPKDRAYVYFKSAIETGFSQMVIKMKMEEMYPKDGPCSVEKLKSQYNEDGDMVDGDEEVFVFGKAWYFCSPKASITPSDCINLKKS